MDEQRLKELRDKSNSGGILTPDEQQELAMLEQDNLQLMKDAESNLNADLAKQGVYDPNFQYPTNSNTSSNPLVDMGNVNNQSNIFGIVNSAKTLYGLQPPQLDLSQRSKDIPEIQGGTLFGGVDPNGMRGTDLKLNKAPTIPSDYTQPSRDIQLPITEEERNLIKLQTGTGGTQYGQGEPSLEDRLSQSALIANYMGAGIDLNSSLYLLGKGIGDKNTPLTVGAAGKSLLAGSRSLLSGLSTAKRNQSTLDYMRQQQRQGITGNYNEVPQFGQDVGGYLFANGGIKIKEENKGKFTAKAKSHQMGVQEFAHHVMSNKKDYPTETIMEANFAINAKKWHKENGGHKNEWEMGGDTQYPTMEFKKDQNIANIIPAYQTEGLNQQVKQLETFNNLPMNYGQTYGMNMNEANYLMELGGYIGKKKYAEGGVSEKMYNPGDKITFKDDKGKVVSGTIKEVKDGEIILED